MYLVKEIHSAGDYITYSYDSLGRISAKAESNSEMTDAEKAAKAGAEKHLTPWSTLQ